MSRLGTWQLRKVQIRYCNHMRSSVGVRSLLHSAAYRDFKKANPQIEFVETQVNGLFPTIDGFYRTNKVDRKGSVRPYSIALRNFSARDVLAQLNYLRNRTATGNRSFTRVKQSPTPTVQGFWHPDLDLANTNTAFEALDLAAASNKAEQQQASMTKV